MPAGVCGIDRITVAVGVGPLVQVGVPRDEPPDLRVVEAAPHQRQTRIAFRPVAARGPELVGAGAAAAAGDGLAEGGERQARCHRLARVRHRPLTAEAVEQRRLPILADQRVPVGVGRRGRAALLLQQHRAAVIQERGRHAARRAGDPPTRRVIGEAGPAGGGELVVVVIRQRVGRARQRPGRLVPVAVVAIGVDKPAARAGQLVVVVVGVGRRHPAHRRRSPVAHPVYDVQRRVPARPRPALARKVQQPVVAVGYRATNPHEFCEYRALRWLSVFRSSRTILVRHRNDFGLVDVVI